MPSSAYAALPASWLMKPGNAGCRTAPRFFSILRKRPASMSARWRGRAMRFFQRSSRGVQVEKALDRAFGEARNRSRMLYWLLYEELYPAVKAFNVFRYVTSRAMFASLTSLFLCVALGPWLIRRLREFQIGQHIREDGLDGAQKKAQHLTMDCC